MGAPTPPLIVQGFGANAGGGYINNPIPVASQIGVTPGAASYHDGFPPITMAPTGGVNPFGQDMNGVLLAATANLAAWAGGQPWAFNATWAAANGGYALGAIIPMASGNGYWINRVSGNVNNPDTTAAATSGWVPLASYGVTALVGLTNANVTLSSFQASNPTITFAGTLTGNVQIIFPTWTLRWTVINKTTGAHSLTCKTASGTGVIIPQATQPSLIAGDGTNIQSLYQPMQSGINWFELPTGQIMQFGDAVMSASAPGTTITFPVPFPTYCSVVVLTPYGGAATTEVLTRSPTNFTGINGAGGTNGWMAFGY